MPAILPKTSSLPLIFVTSTHSDQIGINGAPSSAPGVNWDTQPGLSTFYVQGSTHNTSAFEVYKKIDQTQRAYDGSDTIRLGQCSAMVMTDCDMNDASVAPTQLVSRGFMLNSRYGFNAPTYGSALGLVIYMDVVNSGSSINEYAMIHGYCQVGTASSPTNARNWGLLDVGIYSPVGLQPSIFGGGSIVIKNLWGSSSPTAGQSSGLTIQNLLASGPGGNPSGATASYPIDAGIIISGKATSGNNDAFGAAYQAGGQSSYWTGDPVMGGDMGQNGIGFLNVARNDGITPTSRVGAFVGEGFGEAGGFILGEDSTDVNRVSLSRPSNGNAALHGNLSVTGRIATDRQTSLITTDTPSVGTWTANLATTDWHQATLVANTTVALTGGVVGQSFYLRATQAASGGPYTLTFFSGITWFTSTFSAPTMPTTASAVLLVCFICTGVGTYDGFLIGQSGS